MKKTHLLVLLLSFLCLTGCTNLEEKNTDMAFTRNIPGGSVQLSGNPIWIEATTSTAGVTRHELLLRVTSVGDKVPGGPWIENISPVAGAANFNISGLVDYEFSYVFDIADADKSFERDILTAQFTLEVGESYRDAAGDDQEVWSGVLDTITVVKGKLSKTEIAALNHAGTNFYNHYIANYRFLSKMAYNNGETEKVIHVANAFDPVKMWFIVYDVVPDEIHIHIDCADGSAESDNIPWWWIGTQKFIEFNCHEVADFINIDDKEITGYEISIMKASVKYGTVKVKVDVPYSEVNDQLYILNNTSAIEVINCYGDVAESITTNKRTYTVDASVSPTIFESTVKAKADAGSEPFKINLGFKTLDERRWIKGLLESEIAWYKSERLEHLIGENYGFVPVVINPGSFEIDTTSEDLKSIEIEIQIAHIR